MNMKLGTLGNRHFITHFVGFVLVMVVALGFVSRAEAASLWVENPDWKIKLTDFGYSDLLYDKRPGFEGREYLSGEWAAAITYDGIKANQSISEESMWLEPNFIFPDWTTNSTFGVVNPIADTGSDTTGGYDIYESVISNTDLEITMTYYMEDTSTGIEQGTHPASASDPGSSELSNKYILHQEYEIKNVSGGAITGLDIFQFLHGLNSQEAVYDDRDYGGTHGAYHYDITQSGKSLWWNYETWQEVVNDDTIAFHSDDAPIDWEVEYYGIEGIDDHGSGKPGTGVHLSVEDNLLDGTDFFNQDTLWVSGAQQFALGDLAASNSTSFDVLLSIQTETTVIPEPGTMLLLGFGLLGLVGYGMHRKKKNS